MLRFCDSFDAYGATGDLAKKWNSVGSGWAWTSGAGYFGGGALTHAGGSAGSVMQTMVGALGGSGGQTNWAGYFKFSTTPAARTTLIYVWGSGATQSCFFSLETNGHITGTTADNSTRLDCGVNVCDNKYHWIEFSLTNVNCATYIDNVPQGSTTGGITNGPAPYYLDLRSVNGVAIAIDDFIWFDNAAPAVSSPVNSRQITIQRPISDAAVAFATVVGGSGTHASAVNETVPDGDTSYCQDPTLTNQDLFNMSALTNAPANITGVMLNVYSMNPSGGTINLSGICKSGAAAQSNATATATSLAYTTRQYLFQTDPNTAAAWTPTGLNAAQFGYRNA